MLDPGSSANVTAAPEPARLLPLILTVQYFEIARGPSCSYPRGPPKLNKTPQT